jgi:preprotein translocase subunit SecD
MSPSGKCMKLSILLSFACIFAAAATVFASPPPLFQLRLVLDKPSADSEPMTEIRHDRYDNQTNTLNVQKTVLLDQTALESAKVVNESGRHDIAIHFTKNGAARFAEITRQNVTKRLAIIINGKFCAAPKIMDPISNGSAQIFGGFTQREAKDIVKQINDAVARP